MASAVIHLAIAKELEKYLNISNKKDYYLGAIAPDLAKQINLNRNTSHFSYDNSQGIPNINLFIKKYPNFKQNSFTLGYFIHLYTDKIWIEDFINELEYNNYIKLLDGTIIKTTKKEINNLIYNDYTNLNIQLIDEYNMDLSLFYEDFIVPNTTLNEIPISKLNLLIDKMGIIIENSKNEKSYLFDLIPIKNFIEKSKNELLEKLKNY